MTKKVEVVLLTGMSGAGKSEAIKSFEDMGYFCIDNLPPTLIPRLAEMAILPGSKIKNIALVSDVRAGEDFSELFKSLDYLKEQGIFFQIYFLEADDATLVKRFKETRRKHPLSAAGRISEGIKRERILLQDLRGKADVIINTSNLQAYQLKGEIRSQFLRGQEQKGLIISILSFGYKYGIPTDSDLVIDVRFLPNPHYIKGLSHLTGENKKVKDFVLGRKETKVFIKRFMPLIDFLVPNYFKEGKTHLSIAIGCTGGAHRSVCLANETVAFLKKKKYDVIVRHRDIGKDLARI
ncbi:MAG: RNase adapter RapZ [Actinobacteria bacterium]|nr:MAG: RNase adapter RapZ [Actinomycetota bacterium]